MTIFKKIWGWISLVILLLLLVVSVKFLFWPYANDRPFRALTREVRTLQKKVSGVGVWSSRVCKRRDNVIWRGQEKEDLVVNNFLYNWSTCHGTFVEMGAFDGIFFSISSAYEYFFDWTGALIEAKKSDFEKLRRNRPNVHTFHSATCPEGQNETFMLFQGPTINKIVPSNSEAAAAKYGKKIGRVPCRPLSKLLEEAGLQAIDMFVLDVEDAEYDVLQTMDWSVPVGVWIIEIAGRDKSKDKKVMEEMKRRGYNLVDLPDMAYFNKVFIHPQYKRHLALIHG